MAKTPETQLIEALTKVDVYGDIAPPQMDRINAFRDPLLSEVSRDLEFDRIAVRIFNGLIKRADPIRITGERLDHVVIRLC